MNAVDHVKSALTEAQSALAALIENEATLESIAQAAHAIAESQRQEAPSIPAATAAVYATPCTLPKR